MNHLTGKVALITGGSRGIGRAIALAYAKNGVSVAFSFANDKSAAEETFAAIHGCGVKSLALHADVREKSSIKEMVSRSVQTFGQIDILVNSAGITMPKPWQQLTTQDWNTVIATNLTSAFLATQEVAPAMVSRQWGRIIMLSSVAAQLGGIVGPHYAASKAGLNGHTLRRWRKQASQQILSLLRLSRWGC